MSQSQTLKMGEILIREGYLTMDACQKVLQIQKEQGYISKSRKSFDILPSLKEGDSQATLTPNGLR